MDAAEVIQLHPERDRTDPEFIGEAMRSDPAAVYGEVAVAVGGKGCVPLKAVSGDLDLFKEPFFW
jgi:hypothetical protein